MANKMQNDDACIAKWRELISEFNTVITDFPPVDKVRKQLESIKDKTKATNVLTFHQIGALMARCDNYLKGQYGNTKTAANMAYGAPSSTTKTS